MLLHRQPGPAGFSPLELTQRSVTEGAGGRLCPSAVLQSAGVPCSAASPAEALRVRTCPAPSALLHILGPRWQHKLQSSTLALPPHRLARGPRISTLTGPLGDAEPPADAGAATGCISQPEALSALCLQFPGRQRPSEPEVTGCWQQSCSVPRLRPCCRRS